MRADSAKIDRDVAIKLPVKLDEKHTTEDLVS